MSKKLITPALFIAAAEKSTRALLLTVGPASLLSLISPPAMW